MSNDKRIDSLDKVIKDLYYIADSLKVLRDIYKTGCCNDCKTRDCIYRPKPGQIVRYNCPFYTKSNKDE